MYALKLIGIVLLIVLIANSTFVPNAQSFDLCREAISNDTSVSRAVDDPLKLFSIDLSRSDSTTEAALAKVSSQWSQYTVTMRNDPHTREYSTFEREITARELQVRLAKGFREISGVASAVAFLLELERDLGGKLNDDLPDYFKFNVPAFVHPARHSSLEHLWFTARHLDSRRTRSKDGLGHDEPKSLNREDYASAAELIREIVAYFEKHDGRSPFQAVDILPGNINSFISAISMLPVSTLHEPPQQDFTAVNLADRRYSYFYRGGIDSLFSRVDLYRTILEEASEQNRGMDIGPLAILLDRLEAIISGKGWFSFQ